MRFDWLIIVFLIAANFCLQIPDPNYNAIIVLYSLSLAIKSVVYLSITQVMIIATFFLWSIFRNYHRLTQTFDS